MKKLTICIVALLTLLATNAFAVDVTLEWDANTETDLAGYKIYYKIDGTGKPYNGTTATQGPSPIIITLTDDEDPNPAVVRYTVTGLRSLTPPERYRFAVTAYDNEQTSPPGGLESGYSNEVDTDGVPTDPPNLRIVDVSSQ